jgi:putative two-component system response regulator
MFSREQKTIFVVDDSDTNLALCKKILENAYRVLTVPSAPAMFKLTERIMPDMILLDIEMPDIDGYEALRILKQDPRLTRIPVVFLTVKSNPEAEIAGFELGAVDYITKPFSPPVLRKHIEMHLNLDSIVKSAVSQVQKLHSGIIQVIADMVESRDEVTGGHIERTQTFLEIMIHGLRQMNCYSEEINKWDLDKLIPSAQLHDLGKMSVSDLILNKPGKLTTEEFEIMKTHAIEGEKMIDKIIEKTGDDGFLAYAKTIAGSHHEKWDGTGYPRGRKHEAIPLTGRIMAIADVYDALVSERPYKMPFTHEEAVTIITRDSGKHFDPKLVEVFTRVQTKMRLASLRLN